MAAHMVATLVAAQIVASRSTCNQTCERCRVPSNSPAVGCPKLYVDVGANTGNSLNAFFNGDRRWSPSLNQVLSLSERQEFCADVFEASPSFDASLRNVANRVRRESPGGARCDPCPPTVQTGPPTGQCCCGCRARGRDVQLYLGTPFSLGGGAVRFESLGFLEDAGGTLSFADANQQRRESTRKRYRHVQVVELQSMDAVEYIRSKVDVQHLVLKIDVENYEFKLMPGLIASGVLCDPRRRTDLFIEWHTNRFYGLGETFNATSMGIPEAYAEMPNKVMDRSYSAKANLLWMLRSPVCRTVRVFDWH